MHILTCARIQFTHEPHCKNRSANSGAKRGPNCLSFIAQLLIIDFEIKDTNIC
jgi:hypothetical protein